MLRKTFQSNWHHLECRVVSELVAIFNLKVWVDVGRVLSVPSIAYFWILLGLFCRLAKQCPMLHLPQEFWSLAKRRSSASVIDCAEWSPFVESLQLSVLLNYFLMGKYHSVYSTDVHRVYTCAQSTQNTVYSHVYYMYIVIVYIYIYRIYALYLYAIWQTRR